MNLPAPVRIAVKAAMRLVLVLIFLGIPAAVVFLKVVGFGPGIRDAVADALSIGPVEVAIGRLSFDVVEGMVAEGVSVSLSGSPARKLATVNRAAVALNLAELSSGRVWVDRIELDRADAKIPVGDGGEEVDIVSLSGELAMEAGVLRVSRVEGFVEGVRVMAEASLEGLDRLDLRAREPAAPPELLEKALEFFESIRFAGRQPELEISLTGDLSDPATISAEPVTFRCGPVEGDGWRVESINARARFADERLEIQRLEIGDRAGVLRIWAEAGREAGEAEIVGVFSPQEWLSLAAGDAKWASEIRVPEPIEVAASVQVRLAEGTKPDIRASGSVATAGFSVKGVEFGPLDTEFAWANGKAFLRGARLRTLGGGEAVVDALLDEGDVRLRAAGSGDPTELAPLVDAKARELLETMEFADPAVFSLELRGAEPDFKKLAGSGKLELGRMAMRGVWIDGGVSGLAIGDGAVSYKDFDVKSASGKGSGTFTYDFKRQQVRLADIVSTMWPADVLMWVDPRIAATLRDYRFRKPPVVRGGGTFFMKDLARNDLSFDFRTDVGLDYDLLGETLPLGPTGGTIRIEGPTLKADIREAALMGGEVGVKADVSIDPAKPVFSAEVDVRRIDFPGITKLYFGYEGSEGVASGTYAFKAPLKDPSQMRGEGSIRVEDGNVFAIPLLGPLSELIRTILPGFGYENARLATADFTISGGVIHSKNLEIEGTGFSLYGEGDIFFLRDQMDMSVRLNARGVPGLFLFPVSKLFEYESTGTISKPGWRPKIIPRFGPGGS